MDFNKILAQLLGTHQGSWGTPELGLTEKVGSLLRRPTDPASGGSQVFSGGTNPRPNAPMSVPSGQVMGANDTATNRLVNTGGGGSPAGGQGGSPMGGQNELQLADMARQNRVNSYKAQAGNIRGQAQGAFENILKSIGAFRDRSKTQYDTAGQEITNSASQILGSNARTANETAGSARARGRAMGLGDSSKFNLQNKVEGNLASTQGATIARRGEQDAANRNLLQERQDQAQNQQNEADTYLRGANDRATTIENAGQSAGDEVYGNALNDIVNYQRQLAAINPVQAGGLQQFSPNFSGIANTINSVLSGLTGGGQTGAQEAGNPVNPTSVFDLLKRRGMVQG